MTCATSGTLKLSLGLNNYVPSFLLCMQFFVRVQRPDPRTTNVLLQFLSKSLLKQCCWCWTNACQSSFDTALVCSRAAVSRLLNCCLSPDQNSLYQNGTRIWRGAPFRWQNVFKSLICPTNKNPTFAPKSVQDSRNSSIFIYSTVSWLFTGYGECYNRKIQNKYICT